MVLEDKLDNLTVVVKTFERVKSCAECVKSIKDRYSRLRVVVVDDTDKGRDDYEGAYTVKTERDIGLSAGRNRGVAEVKTEWVLIMDDDMRFTDRTDLRLMMDMAEDRGLDILGGGVGEEGGIWGIEKHGDVMVVGEQGWDMVLNFFMGRVAAMPRWRDELKLCEHTAYFWDCKKAGVRVGYTGVVRVDHIDNVWDNEEYSSRRGNTMGYTQRFMKDEGLRKLVYVRKGYREIMYEGEWL